MKDVAGFWFAASLRYLFALLLPLGLIRVLAAPVDSPLHQYATFASLGVFLLVSAWAYTTTMRRYRVRLAAPPLPVDPRTVRLGRR